MNTRNQINQMLDDHDREHREHTERFIQENQLSDKEAAFIRDLAKQATDEDKRIARGLTGREKLAIGRAWIDKYNESYRKAFNIDVEQNRRTIRSYFGRRLN